jgi:hypothetical protein
MDIDLRNLTNAAAKRSLDMTKDENVRDDMNSAGASGNMDTVLVTDGISTPDVPGEGDEKDRTKRTRKDGANSPSVGSAGSQEDLVRLQ